MTSAARERVRDGHDVSFFVEAGAGTGKTTALVDRVVALVAADHVELRHLAAITFTEAAAAELRDRVRAGLEHVAAGDDERYPDPAARRHCATALDQLDEAALTTLHGFASRILSEHPFDVGLPPGFRVLEDIEASVAFEQRWAALVDDLFADPTLEPALTTWLASELAVARLRPVALAFTTYHDRLPVSADPPPLPAPRAEDLRAALDSLLATRGQLCRDAGDLLAEHIESLVPARDALAAARDELDAFDAIRRVPGLVRRSIGRKAAWTDIAAMRRACEDAEAIRAAIVDEPRRGALAVLTARVATFARARTRPSAAARAASGSTTCWCWPATCSATTRRPGRQPRPGIGASSSTSFRTPIRCRSSWRCCWRPRTPTGRPDGGPTHRSGRAR